MRNPARPGGATGSGNIVSLTGNDLENSRSQRPPQAHFLDDVERGADLRSHLERYAALPADFIKANAGDRFAPSLHCIDWGEP